MRLKFTCHSTCETLMQSMTLATTPDPATTPGNDTKFALNNKSQETACDTYEGRYHNQTGISLERAWFSFVAFE